MVIRNILYAMEVEQDIIRYFLQIVVNLEHALIKVSFFLNTLLILLILTFLLFLLLFF